MKTISKRLLAAVLALVLALPALAAPVRGEAPADLLTVTTGTYTCQNPAIRAGQTYTLIVLRRGDVTGDLTQASLLAAIALTPPLFLGSAQAREDGSVTFENVRLRTSDAADYFVTGPGLAVPLKESTGQSTSLTGKVTTASQDHSATVTLLDQETGYTYSNTVPVGPDGVFALSQGLAPASYILRVTKPGYLPFLRKQYVEIQDGRDVILGRIDISPSVGDVTNDGLRDDADLAALLSWYGRDPASAPASLTPDLSGDGQVDDADVSLLTDQLYDADAALGTPVHPALTVTDSPVDAPVSGLRKLTFSLTDPDTTGLTAGAAAFSLTFRSDYIQAANPSGGAISPVDGGYVANCLTPGPGLTLRSTAWAVAPSLTTLTFSLSAPTPVAAGVLAQFYYRPAQGRTVEDFFPQVFTLPHAAVLAGRDTVVTSYDLTYPNSDGANLSSLTIDQAAAPVTLTIPAAGDTAVLPLSATGVTLSGDTLSPLPGVLWTVEGGFPAGVTIQQDLLLITAQAAPGTLTIHAAQGAVTAQTPLTVVLELAESTPTSVEIRKNNTICVQDILEFPSGEESQVTYTAQVLDQYANPYIPQQGDAAPVWNVDRAPQGVTVQDGVLTIPATLPAGEYTFTLYAGMGVIQTGVEINLTLRPVLEELSISGPQTISIPAAGEEALRVPYSITAYDRLGHPMDPGSFPMLTLRVPDGDAADTLLTGLEIISDNSGSYTLSVSSQALPGERVLAATLENTTVLFPITLQASQQAARAGIYLGGNALTTLNLTTAQGQELSTPLFAQLLDSTGNLLSTQPATWVWALSGAPGAALTPSGNRADLTVGGEVPAGSYTFTLTARETASGLGVSLPVTLRVSPVLAQLALESPAGTSLTIPAAGEVRYPLVLRAADAQGTPMTPPHDLIWSVEADQARTVPGVLVENGSLKILSTAREGTVNVTVQTPDGALSARLTFTLTADQATVLQLYREGRALSAGEDRVTTKAGEPVELTYTAKLLNRQTGQEVPLEEGELFWAGGIRGLTVDAQAEPGRYTAAVTAIYQGRSASVTAVAEVYPNLAVHTVLWEPGDPSSAYDCYDLTLDFDQEELRVPPKGTAAHYTAQVMARTAQGAVIPLSQLERPYTLTLDTTSPGVYLHYDYDAHLLRMDVDSSAITAASYQKYLYLKLDYYPGEDVEETELPLRLLSDTASLSTAFLRRGRGQGSSFTFETISQGAETVSAAAGTYSHCYALEARDQYGNPFTSSALKNATWSLTGAGGKSVSGITLQRRTDLEKAFPAYAGLRRLQVSRSAAPGEYDLTLTVKAGSQSWTLPISLTVTPAVPVETIRVAGSLPVVTIPMYYTTFGRPDLLNSQTETVSYSALLLNGDGQEVDPAGKSITWSVLDFFDSAPAGVTLTGSGASTTLKVNRNAKLAQQTGEEDRRLRVMAACDEVSGTARLELIHSPSIPTILHITREGDRVTSDSFTVDLGQKAGYTYAYQIMDQYDQDVTSVIRSVTWAATGTGSGVTFQNGVLTVAETATLGAHKLTLTATYGAGKEQVRASVPVTVTVVDPNAPSTPVTPPGPGPGGPSGPISPGPSGPSVPGGGGETAPVTGSATVTPPVTQTGATGSATLTAAEEEALLNAPGAGALTIAPTGAGSSTTLVTTLSAAAARGMAEKNRPLQVQTPLGTVLLPPAALTALGGAGSGTVSVSIAVSGSDVTVTFRSGSTVLQTLPGGVTLQANVASMSPGPGTVVHRVNADGSMTLLKKAVVDNGKLIWTLEGSAALHLENRTAAFADTADHWAGNAVSFVAARELFQGTSPTAFSPGGDMTRSMLVTVLHRLENTPAGGANPFTDVPNTWYTAAVSWANAKGIVQGISATQFAPDTPVTREQLATILFRYAKAVGLSTTGRAALGKFPDQAAVSGWAQEAVQWAVHMGLINGKGNGALDPGGKASRAEVATILERLIRAMAPAV